MQAVEVRKKKKKNKLGSYLITMYFFKINGLIVYCKWYYSKKLILNDNTRHYLLKMWK